MSSYLKKLFISTRPLKYLGAGDMALGFEFRALWLSALSLESRPPALFASGIF
jgi:hypothetical protein